MHSVPSLPLLQDAAAFVLKATAQTVTLPVPGFSDCRALSRSLVILLPHCISPPNWHQVNSDLLKAAFPCSVLTDLLQVPIRELQQVNCDQPVCGALGQWDKTRPLSQDTLSSLEPVS
ncbi:hypothetical protein SRHO_G00190360 [Serrasalmus rhombeus]